jgi:hypothetical protein
MHSVPVPINVRCSSNSDIIVRRSELTPRATSRLMHRSKFSEKGIALHGTLRAGWPHSSPTRISAVCIINTSGFDFR